MASNPLRQKLKTILDTFDSLSRQSGVVEKEALLLALGGQVEAVEAEELIQHLVREGIFNSPRAGILEKP
jgi:molybdopterin biosynthesis enzyme MoaB